MNPNPDEDNNLRIARAIRGELPGGFVPVPLALNRFVELAMRRDATQGTVSAAKRGPLQNWAKKKRKAKAAAESRRRNRRSK